MKQLTWIVCTLIVLMFVAVVVWEYAGNQEPATSQSLSREVRDAWQAAGAEFVWMSWRTGGLYRPGDKDRKPDEIPAFVWADLREFDAGTVRELPDPGIPFGLNLVTADLTNKDIEQISRFSRLQMLNLHSARITSEGIRSLGGFINLQALNLGQTQLTDDGLKNLRALTKLQSLFIYYTAITDSGLEHLSAFKQMRMLDVSNTSISDAGLDKLAVLTELDTLSVDHTEVSDKGLKRIVALKNLKSLSLWNTRVTNEGVSDLLKALPALTVRR